MLTDVSPALYRWAVSVVVLMVVKMVVDKAFSIQRAFAKIKGYPGRVLLWIDPFTALGLALGPRFPRPGMSGYYAAKFSRVSAYKKFGATVFTSVTLTNARRTFWLADPEAMRRVTSDRHTFQKDVASYGMVNFCGPNLVTLEGPDWKRHRSVAMSAFNEANTALVWSETLRVTSDWFKELDVSGPDVTVDLRPAIAQMILLVTAAAGFGKRVSWSVGPKAETPPGYKLTFRAALVNSIHGLIFRAITPEWFYKLSSLIKVPYLSSRALHTRLAFDELRIHMLDLVASARTAITSGELSGISGAALLRIHMLDLVASARTAITSGELSGISGAALLRNLVEANMNQDGAAKKLADGEVLSDIFIFLLAGRETTAHTLCFALTLLALYPDCQKQVYEEVTRVWPADVPATQTATHNHGEYMDKFEYTLACIRETLRLFPLVPRIPKDVEMDTVLPGTYFTVGSKWNAPIETGKFMMAVPAGSPINLDVWGLHMNPLCWGEDAAEFKPGRFLDTESYRWPRSAFMPFSAGARSCIGQRFALTEATGVIASIVRRYQICIPDDLAKKPFEEQKEVLLKWTSGISLMPLNARVKLCRRI